MPLLSIVDGKKTYLGGTGLILFGLGGLLSGKLDVITALTQISSGLAVIGFRSFGDKVLTLLTRNRAR